MDNSIQEHSNHVAPRRHGGVQRHNESSYWKSLRDFHNSNEASDAKTSEFMAGVTDSFEPEKMSAMSRKQFLGLVSASAAFAAAGCTNYRDKGEIVPYNKKPEELTLGIANYYASTCNGCEQSCGILIKTREGRPIKIDGNPDHPVNKGKICSKGQASILNLYSPERLKDPMQKIGIVGFNTTTWNNIDGAITLALKSAVANKKEIAVVTHTISSPTTKKLLDEFIAKFPTAKIYSYELFHNGNRASAWTKSTGGDLFPLLKWDKAKVILALESDFLGNEGNVMEQTRMFVQNRDVMKSKNFNRLYSAEGTMSSTAMNADYRLRVRPDQQLDFVLSLLNEIVIKKKVSRFADDAKVSALLNNYSLEEFASKHSLDKNAVEVLVKDLLEHQGKAIIHAGNSLPESVHVAVNFLNEVLGNTVLYNNEQSAAEHIALSNVREFESLVQKMNSNQVEVVIHFDSNPVYHLASDLGYAEALKKVKVTATLAETENETSDASLFTLPIHHAFESWNDFKTRTGIVSLQQPVIAPMYNTRQKEAVLLQWMNGNPDAFTETIYHQFLMTRWEKEVYPSAKAKVDFKTFWYSSLHDGVVEFAESPKSSGGFKTEALVSVATTTTTSKNFVLFLHDNYTVGDGRFASNGWLQETPHPASKIVWDNYAALSPDSAKELGVKNDDKIVVEVNNVKLTLPVFVQPGLADKLVAVMLGYGRTAAGVVGSNVGMNANVFISKSASVSPWLYTDAKVSKTSGTYTLVSTQEHHALDDTFLKDLHFKREIIQEGTVAEYKNEPDFLSKEHHVPTSITHNVEYNGVKWAMSIDLNKCTGCNVCTASCNVENNIPVVGKEQVRLGREMAWIRIDRYFSGTPNTPKVSNQPMLCQHCDNAPCENVCPVVATSHSADGLNQMVYNRCVGTKYCSNNCPYKVRRFNFYDFRDQFADEYQQQEPLNMMHNPEVTVRSRGVMEKCTFCIQRIMEARQHAIEDNRELKGSDVVTACQQACPSEAIVFGDMNDKNSLISKYRTHELGYHVLEEINVRPNVTYIAKLRNVSETEKA